VGRPPNSHFWLRHWSSACRIVFISRARFVTGRCRYDRPSRLNWSTVQASSCVNGQPEKREKSRSDADFRTKTCTCTLDDIRDGKTPSFPPPENSQLREPNSQRKLNSTQLYLLTTVARIVIQAYPVPAVRFASFVLLMHYKLSTVYL